MHLLYDDSSRAADAALLPAAAAYLSHGGSPPSKADLPAALQQATSSPAAAAAAAGDVETAGAAGALPGVAFEASGVEASGFTHAQRLPALRQQALLQITKSQLEAAQAAPDPGVAAAATAALQASTGRGDPALTWQQQQQLDVSTADSLQLTDQQQVDANGDVILGLVAKAGNDQQGCFKMFNPADEAEYRRVVGDWLASFLLMLRHMANGEGFKTVEAAVSQRRNSRG
jgi:hypothetical protein